MYIRKLTSDVSTGICGITFYDFYHCRYGRLPKPLREEIQKFYRDKTELKGVAGQELFYMLQKAKLNSMIHSSNYSKYIMEPIVTIRNNRFVIPIKIEDKDKINGFVHDISASGSTVFVEPTAVFELNNKINNLKIEENFEIEAILEDLSLLCTPITDNLKNLITILGKLDFIFAKANFSIAINGIEPEINNEKFLSFIEARHPLIDKNKVVPINITLGKDYNSLIITGPNTGGKTVTLKTVGLLTLMATSRSSYSCKRWKFYLCF